MQTGSGNEKAAARRATLRVLAPGLRAAVAALATRGRRPVYSMALVNGWFVYFVQVPK